MPTKKIAPEKAVAKTPRSTAKAPKIVDKVPKSVVQKSPQQKTECSLMIEGAKFVKVPFFVDVKKDDIIGKQRLLQRASLS